MARITQCAWFNCLAPAVHQENWEYRRSGVVFRVQVSTERVNVLQNLGVVSWNECRCFSYWKHVFISTDRCSEINCLNNMGKQEREKSQKTPSKTKPTKNDQPQKLQFGHGVIFAKLWRGKAEHVKYLNFVVNWCPVPKIHPRCACNIFNAVFKVLQSHCTF